MGFLDMLLSAIRVGWHPRPNLRFCTPPPRKISINSMLGPSNGPFYCRGEVRCALPLHDSTTLVSAKILQHKEK